MAVALSVAFSFLVMTSLGLVLGFGLSLASRVFEVKKDRRVEQIEAALPGLNCGVCGFPGFAQYAAAARIAGAMNSSGIAPRERMVSQVHCRGWVRHALFEFEYRGLADCVAAQALFGGSKVCKHGCVNLGSCVKVCPTGVMRWLPYSADRLVACNSIDRGADVRGYCAVGCIACKVCERRGHDLGFSIEDNLARIDYSKRGERGEVASGCPTNCIVPNSPTSPALPARALPAKAEGNGEP